MGGITPEGMEDSFKEEEKAKAEVQILEMEVALTVTHSMVGISGQRERMAPEEVEERFKEKEAKAHHTNTDVGMVRLW